MLPLVDLNRKISRFRSEIDRATDRVLNSGSLVLGSEVSTFEERFADYLGISHCISVANGTDALEIALRAVGVQDGSIIIAAANAGNYTRTAANLIGAKVVYADVDFETRNLTAASIEPLLKSGAKFVVLTHLYGLAVSEIVEISEMCDKFNAVLIEDCAQSHGAEVNGVKVGNFGKIASFSFYPTKNLGALGDGGAIVTNDAELSKRIRGLRTYGWDEKYSVGIPFGRNSRLDEIQAAYLSVFLKELDQDNSRRREIAQLYISASEGSDFESPVFVGKEFVAHLYVIWAQDRRRAMEHFHAYGIATAIHYPISDYNQPYLRNHSENISLRVTDQLSSGVLTLPCFPEMSPAEVELVCGAISSFRAR